MNEREWALARCNVARRHYVATIRGNPDWSPFFLFAVARQYLDQDQRYHLRRIDFAGGRRVREGKR